MMVEFEVDRIKPVEFCLKDLDEAVVEDLAKSIGKTVLLQMRQSYVDRKHFITAEYNDGGKIFRKLK